MTTFENKNKTKNLVLQTWCHFVAERWVSMGLPRQWVAHPRIIPYPIPHPVQWKFSTRFKSYAFQILFCIIGNPFSFFQPLEVWAHCHWFPLPTFKGWQSATCKSHKFFCGMSQSWCLGGSQGKRLTGLIIVKVVCGYWLHYSFLRVCAFKCAFFTWQNICFWSYE